MWRKWNKIIFIKNDGHKLGIINRFHRTFKEELTTYFINNIYVTDLELLEYLFNDKEIYSFTELYKYAKMAHPKITQKIVKNFFINQQSVQMNNKKVGEKIF